MYEAFRNKAASSGAAACLSRIDAVSAAAARVERLTTQIRALLPQWRLAPVVAALQALRGISLVTAVIAVAEIGDLTRFADPRQLMA
ncbi:MAG TPA: transposase [Pyrinomonadaceae bacterium]|nr:transposase [Pyrinomonadaceae bacterium]